MKTKTLATALTVSMPLLFGSAYAQTTTSAESGNNRSGDGGAMTTNPSPASSADTTTSSGTGVTTAPSAGSTSGTTAPATTGAATGTMNEGAATGTTAGSTAPGAAMSDSAASTEAITGWSAKDDFIGKSVFNENDEKIGDINDIVIASDGRGMYLLIGAGGFLGMGEKHVAVPFDRVKRMDNRILLSGYSKEQLKALPEVRTQR